MGLNFVIGCHRCKERVWMFRGEEVEPLHNFYRRHWKHSDDVELTDDQSLKNWQHEYPDRGEEYGVKVEQDYSDIVWRGTEGHGHLP